MASLRSGWVHGLQRQRLQRELPRGLRLGRGLRRSVRRGEQRRGRRRPAQRRDRRGAPRPLRSLLRADARADVARPAGAQDHHRGRRPGRASAGRTHPACARAGQPPAVHACVDTYAVRRSRAVRTGCVYQPPACCTYPRRRAACPLQGRGGAPLYVQRTRTSLERTAHTASQVGLRVVPRGWQLPTVAPRRNRVWCTAGARCCSATLWSTHSSRS